MITGKALFAAAFALVATAALAGETIKLRRGVVVPIRFESQLSLKENRVGDRFGATVQGDRDLPDGTRFLGQIAKIEPASGDRAGYMDLDFDTMILPDGGRFDIVAVPIRMDDKAVRKGTDGRFTAKKKLEDTSKHVLGGMIGGYLLGRILGDDRGTGIILGAIAGIIVAESERSATSDEVVIKRDAKMGALFERDVQFEYDARAARDPRFGDARGDSEPDRTPIIEYEGKPLRFEGEAVPYRDGETWMVPLEATAHQLGLSVEGTDSRRILVEDDDAILVLEQQSKNYRLNGKRGSLSKEVTRRSDLVYVPIDALSMAKNGQMTINGIRIEK